MIRILFLAAALLLPRLAFAEESLSWILPQVLSESNARVSFEVASTWHLVHGEAGGINGRVWLKDDSDPMSIQSEIHFPVKRFDTQGKLRDSKLREVMAAERFPEVIFKTSAIQGGCSPLQIAQKSKCEGALVGSLNIRGVEKQVELPYTISIQQDEFVIEGRYSFQWADYGVEDPSILIAKLDKTVTVKFACRIPLEKKNNG